MVIGKGGPQRMMFLYLCDIRGKPSWPTPAYFMNDNVIVTLMGFSAL